MRVSQPWAGGSHGLICIPRIGNEVIVEFLDGDPDRPLVTGSVYNPAQMPPYVLPANSHTMGFKSNTTKGGGGYNEMAIVDGKAGELIRIHAQKDMDTTVLNDDRQLVVVNRRIEVHGKHDEIVVKDMSTTVTEGHQTNTVKAGNQTNTVETGSQKNKVSQQIEITSDCAYINVTAGTEINLKAGTKITLQVGASSVTMTPEEITIVSPLVNINP